MTQPKKFLFEESFDRAAPEQAGAADKPKTPVFTEDDLAAAEKRGFDAGRSAAIEEAGRSAEERIAGCLASLAAQLGELDLQVMQARERHERETVELARHALVKMFPALSQQGALAECERVIESCLAKLRNEPRVVLRTADNLHDLLRERVEELAQRAGFEGRIVLLTDEALGPSDVRVEWADGGAERDAAGLWSEIETIISRAFSVPEQTAPFGSSTSVPETAAPQTPPPGESAPEATERVPETEITEPEPTGDARADRDVAGLAATA